MTTDWRIRPSERSLEPPPDDEPDEESEKREDAIERDIERRIDVLREKGGHNADR